MNYTLQQLIEKGHVTKVEQRNANDGLKITLKTTFPTIEKIDVVIADHRSADYAVSAANKILAVLDDIDGDEDDDYEDNNEDDNDFCNDDYEDDYEDEEDEDDSKENEDYEADEDLTESLRHTRGR